MFKGTGKIVALFAVATAVTAAVATANTSFTAIRPWHVRALTAHVQTGFNS
jgi:hypothetical protein